jgi:hypothetical protein
MAKFDLKDLKIDQLVGDIRDEAGKRAADLLGESRSQIKDVRRKVADPNDGDMLGGFALGMLVGALIGAAVALLLAPQSGEQARRTLSERVKNMREGTPEWESGGSSSGDGRVYQGSPSFGATTTPAYGAASPGYGAGGTGTGSSFGAEGEAV